MDTLIDYALIVPCAIIAIVLHELSHGYVSYLLGDPTPKEMGRLTLNPIKHLDIVGTICLIFFHFGWAKPVIVDPRYYKKPKLGMALVGLAGPLMNLVIAFVSSFFLVLVLKLSNGSSLLNFFTTFFLYLTIINLGLCFFNLIPFPPLDGSKIVACVLNDEHYYQFMKYQRYSTIFLIALLVIFNALESAGIGSPLASLVDIVLNAFINLWAFIL